MLRKSKKDYFIVFENTSNTAVGSIVRSNNNTAYNTSSDYRLKENVVAISDGITRLKALKPSRFNFISEPSITMDGFLAHEVSDVVPEAVVGEKDAVDEDGEMVTQQMDNSRLVPLLVATVQELSAKIKALESA